MADTLIICPVGMGVTNDPRWKVNDHWRWTHNDRKYETLVVSYNDFIPEKNSYDYLLKIKGHKWQIMKNIHKYFSVDKYKYIGCVDDDLITDYQSFNLGIGLAEEYNFSYWQLSMPPDSDLHPTYHNCLQQDKSCTFTDSTFIEMGSPFFRIDKFKFLMEFLQHWDFKVGMGIDRVLYDLFECPSNVVHSATIHQPHRTSYYDKSEATAEMYDFMYSKYGQILKEFYGRDSHFNDSLKVLNKYKVNYDKT